MVSAFLTGLLIQRPALKGVIGDAVPGKLIISSFK